MLTASTARFAAPFWFLVAIACNSHVVATDDFGEPAGGDSLDMAEGGFGGDGKKKDLTPGPDLAGKPPGAACTMDGECMSGACKPLPGGAGPGPGSGSICVVPCMSQAECAGLPGGMVCEPKAPLEKQGYCLPPSPFHCATCEQDSDCGGYAERCTVAPGDLAPACHIDCSLSATACPNDYQCASIDAPAPSPGPGTITQMLCVPKIKICLDALGGFCDRLSLPQPCLRKNDAGVCTGQRTCLTGGRYDKCGATAPQYKQCSDMDPPGCVLKLAPGATQTKDNCGSCGNACATAEDCCAGVCKALSTATDCGKCGNACVAGSGCCSSVCTALNTLQNCGKCGNVCPGQGLATNDVSCDAATRTCGMTCRGDNYDVDTVPGNGCEVLDALPPGHSQPTAASRGSKPCDDGASSDNFGSGMPSDRRVHMNPPVDSFNGSVGSAPDWWIVHADGGTFCQDDYSVTFATSGGGGSVCYRLTLFTNKTTDSVTVSGAGSAGMSGGWGSYSDGSDIYFKIEKICSTPAPENVKYAVSYHL